MWNITLYWLTDMRDAHLSTPCYVIDEAALIHNLRILKTIKERTNCHILLASKAFSCYHVFPLIAKYLDGVTSSGLYEARLGREEMNKEVHTYSPAYKEEEFDAIVSLSDHIVFNSIAQWNKYKDKVDRSISCGLRINPQYSEIEVSLYDPCCKGSRLGSTINEITNQDIRGIEGLHFHTMCEQGASTLQRTIEVVERDFSHLLRQVKWLNMGGGHHITKEGYDCELLIKLITHMQQTYDIEVYLEPGEAVALHAGYLLASVLDIHGENAILDVSAACHMPDVLEMPYRPNVKQGFQPKVKPYTYTLAGNTCLAGDCIGRYSFEKPLQLGNHIVFEDMAIYTMVKNTTFNGMPLPSIYVYTTNKDYVCLKQFSYEDFKRRL